MLLLVRYNFILQHTRLKSFLAMKELLPRHGSSESLSVFEFVSRRVLGLETSPMKQDFRTSLKNKVGLPKKLRELKEMFIILSLLEV